MDDVNDLRASAARRTAVANLCAGVAAAGEPVHDALAHCSYFVLLVKFRVLSESRTLMASELCCVDRRCLLLHFMKGLGFFGGGVDAEGLDALSRGCSRNIYISTASGIASEAAMNAQPSSHNSELTLRA